MEDVALDDAVKAVDAVRYRLNPYELNSFDCAKEQMEDAGYMTHRQEEFVRWQYEKYVLRGGPTQTT